ncbi:MAG: glycosyltransferase [Bdellovibrionota bacterium]|jgi:glycosyltransferase involved in cell wall biosynthesis
MAKREIHQLVHTLSYGDAISGEVLALQRCFHNLGFASEIFAINVHPLLKGRAKSYQELPLNFNGEVLFHFSLGSPLSDLYKNITTAKRSMIFHNLTDPHWFKGVNPRIVADLENGQKQLPEMCQVTDRLIADSPFNAKELKKYGFDAEVLELPIDEEKWGVEPNSGIAAMLAADPSLHLVHTGRLAPNKCIEDIIKTFYFLHHKINRQSKLWLVGIDIDTELYSFSLKRMVDEFDLTDAVNFVGCLADSELKALYQNADVYLCMSEHEGFCLPVIEAMYFNLPVITFDSTALSDTVGDGAIIVKEKRHHYIAEMIQAIFSDSSLRDKLKQAGAERAKHFSFERFSADVARIFKD